jgi:hypothetical protein
VGAALDEEGVLLAADPLQAVHEVGDELDLEVADALEVHVAPDGPLVAGAGWPQGHDLDAAARGYGGGHVLKITQVLRKSNFLPPGGFLDMVSEVL